MLRLIINRPNGDIITLDYHSRAIKLGCDDIKYTAMKEIESWNKGNLKIEIIDTREE